MDSPELPDTITADDTCASLTIPKNAGKLKKGDYVVIAGAPCKIASIKFCKTGKHGHAKANIVAFHIFTGARFEDGGLPTSHNVEVPVVTLDEYQLIGVSEDGYASLLNADTGNVDTSLKLPPPDNLRQNTGEEAAKFATLKAAVNTADEVLVTVQRAMGMAAIVV